ncbi:50S ribosomal protein L33 [Microgenomates group bacterium RBG_16_45_19]|nr:MAG: 50S ribosomal protein L33 [Microgenomates group bacterium RBG_16_45_19]
MASKKGPRQFFGLKCSVCKNFNYLTERNKLNTPDKLKLKKYCKHCRKVTEHKETSKLK